MSGFPTRPSRATFGPRLENRRPVRDPRREFDASFANLALWQVAGLGTAGPIAWVLCAVADDVSVVAHAEAWNPDGALAGPEVTRTAGGIYLVEYAANYPDDDGVDTPLALLFGAALPQASGEIGTAAEPLVGVVTKASGSSFQVDIIRISAFGHRDADFAALFW